MAKNMKTGGRDFQPGNPGRPPLPSDVKEIRRLNTVEFERLANKYLYMSADEAEVRMKDKSLPLVELMIASVIHQAIARGDQLRLNFVLDRLIGRVPVKIQVPIGDMENPVERTISGLSDEQVKIEYQRLIGAPIK